MKRIWTAGLCAAMLLCTACGDNTAENSAGDQAADGLTVQASDEVEPAYIDCIKRYFEAIDHKDYETYRAAMYPPYLEAYEAYLEQDGTAPEDAFADLCARFDEDGYDDWTLTEIDLSYYPEEKVDLDGFFDAYVSAGFFDADFADTCRAETEEIRDVQFTLYALYSGDAEAVPVVSGSELMVVKTADGVYLFG